MSFPSTCAQNAEPCQTGSLSKKIYSFPSSTPLSSPVQSRGLECTWWKFIFENPGIIPHVVFVFFSCPHAFRDPLILLGVAAKLQLLGSVPKPPQTLQKDWMFLCCVDLVDISTPFGILLWWVGFHGRDRYGTKNHWRGKQEKNPINICWICLE